MVKVGIIGAGYIAGSHADAYDAHPDAELVYVTDSLPEKAEALARRYGATVAEHSDELLASDVDVVSVCTPSP